MKLPSKLKKAWGWASAWGPFIFFAFDSVTSLAMAGGFFLLASLPESADSLQQRREDALEEQVHKQLLASDWYKNNLRPLFEKAKDSQGSMDVAIPSLPPLHIDYNAAAIKVRDGGESTRNLLYKLAVGSLISVAIGVVQTGASYKSAQRKRKEQAAGPASQPDTQPG
jgi:hypothetical protein